jgi:hypothetical protein
MPACPSARSGCPEPVEGLSFLFQPGKEGQGFDKLSPNGFGVIE